MISFEYIYSLKMKTGLQGHSAREILESAMQIGSGQALETGINIALTLIGEGARRAGISGDARTVLMKEALESEPFFSARARLKAIRHEAA